MRVHLVLLVTVAAGVSAEEGGGILQTISSGLSTAGAAISSVYTTYETAPYTVQDTVVSDDNATVLYEQRLYAAQNWVCTTEVEEVKDKGRKDAFMRLFAYITGDNGGGQKIPMTTPVSMMRVSVTEAELASQEDQGIESEEEGEESEEEEEAQSKFTMCFYINSENQENTPIPNSPEVFIENRPAMTVLANQDGGYMSEKNWEVMAEKLKEDSMAKGEASVDYSKFYRAGYDSPMKFWNRRNEVWYVKQL